MNQDRNGEYKELFVCLYFEDDHVYLCLYFVLFSVSVIQ